MKNEQGLDWWKCREPGGQKETEKKSQRAECRAEVRDNNHLTRAAGKNMDRKGKRFKEQGRYISA